MSEALFLASRMTFCLINETKIIDIKWKMAARSSLMFRRRPHAVFEIRTSQLAHKLKIKGKKRTFLQPSTQLTGQPTLLLAHSLIFILLSSRRELIKKLDHQLRGEGNDDDV